MTCSGPSLLSLSKKLYAFITSSKTISDTDFALRYLLSKRKKVENLSFKEQKKSQKLGYLHCVNRNLSKIVWTDRTYLPKITC